MYPLLVPFGRIISPDWRIAFFGSRFLRALLCLSSLDGPLLVGSRLAPFSTMLAVLLIGPALCTLFFAWLSLVQLLVTEAALRSNKTLRRALSSAKSPTRVGRMATVCSRAIVWTHLLSGAAAEQLQRPSLWASWTRR